MERRARGRERREGRERRHADSAVACATRSPGQAGCAAQCGLSVSPNSFIRGLMAEREYVRLEGRTGWNGDAGESAGRARAVGTPKQDVTTPKSKMVAPLVLLRSADER